MHPDTICDIKRPISSELLGLLPRDYNGNIFTIREKRVVPLSRRCEVRPTSTIETIAVDFLLLFIIPQRPITAYIGTK
ncbi:Uncharacterised protein [Chlamydia trachomatis]|nr:Uncharacterised protein [Chlamydia trachomatis]